MFNVERIGSRGALQGSAKSIFNTETAWLPSLRLCAFALKIKLKNYNFIESMLSKLLLLLLRKNIMFWVVVGLFCVWAPYAPLEAQTIAEKKAAVTGNRKGVTQAGVEEANAALREKRQEINDLYHEVRVLYLANAPEESYKQLLNQIKLKRREYEEIERAWQKDNSFGNTEGYALWQQIDGSVYQLVVDYGSDDYLYLIPPEIGQMRITYNSNLPVLRASWEDLLTLILEQMGIGIKTINPFLKELILVDKDWTSLRRIVTNESELETLPGTERIAFVLNPSPLDLQRIITFLSRFSDKKKVVLQQIDRSIWIMGPVSSIKELLKLYAFSSSGEGNKDYRFVTLKKVDAEEMASILQSLFGASGPGPKPPVNPKEPGAARAEINQPLHGLKVLTLTQLAHALFLQGSKAELDKAEEVIHDIEGGMGEAQKKTLFWYTAKNSDPEELAEVLSKIYPLLDVASPKEEMVVEKNPLAKLLEERGGNYIAPEQFYADNVVVNPSPIAPSIEKWDRKPEQRGNFIVDPKTGSIVMVVDTVYLPQIKDLLKRIDVPKKMVQIEVVLFEKRMTDTDQFGLSNLKTGTFAANTNVSGISWNGINSLIGSGILTLALSHLGVGEVPSYDIAYTFLVSQDDIQINASPQVTTVNQTPAQISIVEEISIDTGVQEVPIEGGFIPKQTFLRHQYGITIKVTPTIHDCGEVCYMDPNPFDRDKCQITLDTEVSFDTINPGGDPSRPDVTRRLITNQVRVADGETVILGGLRRKTEQDSRVAIPFLGEIPGIGVLFSSTEMIDSTTEMYLFLTPHVLEGSHECLERMRCEELSRRPGDVPEAIACMIQAIEWEKRELFSEGLKMIFGRPCEPTKRNVECCGCP